MTPPFKLDTLVELQDQYSNVYPLSPTGARGWVRARRELPKTDPEAYIEWDKGHWRYHGEKDGWTFEHHFSAVVDDLVPDIHTNPVPEYCDVLDEAQRRADEDRCPDCGGFHGDEYLDGLMQAQEAALEADGYIIITIAPREINGTVVYEPEIFTEALTPTARAVIETQIVQMATQLFEADMLGRVSGLEGMPMRRADDDPGR